MAGASLALRIPPAAVCAIAIGLPYLYGSVPANLNTLNIAFAACFALSGIVVGTLAILQFKAHQTTVDPRDPAQTSSLITSGIFRYSRNPIYLAMALLILANGVALEDWGGLILALLFCVYIQYFQILPEERALRQTFGDAFIRYSQRTRRWLGITTTDDAR